MIRGFAVLCVVTLIVGHSHPAVASGTRGHTEVESGNVTVSAAAGPVYTSGSGSGVRCRWNALTRGDVAAIGGTGAALTPEEAVQPAIRVMNGREHRLYSVACPTNGTSLRYIPTGVGVGELIPGITDEVTRQLQPPIPSISPPAEVNGIVNLGLWLAVEPQTIDPITAQAGPSVWITVAPVLATTTFDLGNGDVVTCEATGVRIEDVHPDLDVVEQSPTCGYTYRRSSPDDQPYQLTITTTWQLPYTSSEGGGEIPPLERTLTVAYDVDEIQTIGERG